MQSRPYETAAQHAASREAMEYLVFGGIDPECGNDAGSAVCGDRHDAGLSAQEAAEAY